MGCTFTAEKFMIKNSNLSIQSIYTILWAHMQHTNYATLHCIAQNFPLEQIWLRKSFWISYGWVKLRNSIDHWFTFTVWIKHIQATEFWCNTIVLAEWFHPPSAFSSCLHNKGKTEKDNDKSFLLWSVLLNLLKVLLPFFFFFNFKSF